MQSSDFLPSIFIFRSFFSFSYDQNEYEEEEQYHGKSSNAVEMPETFGNAASSSSDSFRDKKYR